MVERKIIGFSIGIAAERIGMHPQTLREYERKGLVTPHRTSGGARRYRDAELERLRRIQHLTEQGLSLAAVAYVIGLEDDLQRQSMLIEQLEQRLHDIATDIAADPTVSVDLLPVRRTMSVEVVHVPRRPRGPRWSNRQG